MNSNSGRPELRIGTSGYQYDHWKGLFYPPELRKADWLGHYAARFDTVEINNTFYSLPAAEVFERWKHSVPSSFLFVLKFSRFATHMKKLKDPEDSISRFLERAEKLEDRLGPILVQLPPRFKADPGRLEEFLRAAPKRHRWALEFRDPSWLVPEVFAVLRAHGSALCVHDMIPQHPEPEVADWIYLRYHGDHYAGSYSSERLRAEANKIEEHLKRGRDVYAYFNNDVGGHAIHNAGDLRRYLTGM